MSCKWWFLSLLWQNGQTQLQRKKKKKEKKKIYKGRGNTAFIDVLSLHGSCLVTNRPFRSDKRWSWYFHPELCLVDIIQVGWSGVMVLAEIGLILFVEAHTMPHFGFLIEIVVTTRRCFSCCRTGLKRRQGRFCFSCYPASKEAGGAPGAGRGHRPGQMTQTDQRDSPYHLVSYSAIKLR